MASIRRAVAVAVVGSVVAGGIVLALYPHLPAVVVQHTSGTEPDGWTSRGSWLRFALPFSTLFPLAMFGFVALVSMSPAGFHTPDARAQAYWSSPEHWPQARAILLESTAWLTALLAVFVALALSLVAGSQNWGLPTWLAGGGPVIVLLAGLAWYTVHLVRAFRLPASAR